MRLLLVEDNERLAELVVKGCSDAGFAVDAVHSAEDARLALDTVSYDAVLLDLGLPDEDGLDVLKWLRAGRRATPVLVLTARDTVTDRVDGLNAGADDYLPKPFAMEELVARIRAILRRPGGALGRELEAGNTIMDTVAREVRIDGAVASCSKREMDVLEMLMRRLGHVVTKRGLEDSIYPFGEEIASNSIEVCVHRLRKRLSDAQSNVVIHTVRGVGYILDVT